MSVALGQMNRVAMLPTLGLCIRVSFHLSPLPLVSIGTCSNSLARFHPPRACCSFTGAR